MGKVLLTALRGRQTLLHKSSSGFPPTALRCRLVKRQITVNDETYSEGEPLNGSVFRWRDLSSFHVIRALKPHSFGRTHNAINLAQPCMPGLRPDKNKERKRSKTRRKGISLPLPAGPS
jgi:hypothetical protein